MNITTATPVEIDTVLAEIMGKRAELSARMEGIHNSIHRAARDEQEYVGSRWSGKREWKMAPDEAILAAQAVAAGAGEPWDVTAAQRALAAYDAALAEAKALTEQAAPLNAEFHRRGGWTRAFLATSSNGHIHSSQSCSTCYATTTFFWFVDLSGHDEAEIVAKAGSDACTVCYPSAPVNDLKRPRSIFSDDEKAAQQARQEREEKAAAKKALEVTVEGMARNYRDGIARPKTYKTERAVELAISEALTHLAWYPQSTDATQYKQDVQNCAQALADRRGTTVEAIVEPIKARVEKKVAKQRKGW